MIKVIMLLTSFVIPTLKIGSVLKIMNDAILYMCTDIKSRIHNISFILTVYEY